MGWKEKEQKRKYYQENKEVIKERSKKRAKNRYYYLKAKLDEVKGNLGCARCANKDVRVLTFHHRDPSTKADTVSNMMRYSNWGIMELEIDKCDVLCFNCHEIVEAEIRDGK